MQTHLGCSAATILFYIYLLLLPQVAGKRVTNPAKVPKTVILLSKVASLTLRQGKQTTSRRVNAVPQLSCVGPSDICKLYAIDTLRCTNEGADYEAENIQWSCKASMPPEFKLGSTEVVCEGYESSEDPYVLKGSCAVDYRLALTDAGEEKYGRHTSGSSLSSGFGGGAGGGGETSRIGTIIFLAIFAAVLFIILRGFWSSLQNSDGQRRPRRPGGFGGFGGNDDDDGAPPPPYDDHQPYTKGSRTTSTRSGSSRAGAQGQGQQWRPGFWTGAATGAAAGYFAGQQGQNRAQTQQQQQQQQQPRNWFSGRGGPSAAGPSTSSSSSSTPSFSTSRHESTGFGGTSRR